MVIVVPGLKTVETGPYKGSLTVGNTKIYLNGQQVGLLSGFRLSMNLDSPMPEAHFDFASGVKEEDLPNLSSRVKASLDRYISLIKTKLPWATWTSPGNSSPVQPLNVLDLGQISPTTPKSKDSG